MDSDYIVYRHNILLRKANFISKNAAFRGRFLSLGLNFLIFTYTFIEVYVMSNKKESKNINSLEECIMAAAVRIRQDEFEMSRKMQEYAEQLKKQSKENPAKAKADAKIALVRTGVLTKNGNAKRKIVSWE